MKKIFIISAVVLLSCITFDLFSQSKSADKQEKLLNKAFKFNSYKKLDKFLDNWHKEVTPITDKELNELSDTICEVYNLFKVIYKPFSMNKPKYVIFQKQIEVNVLNNSLYKEAEEIIKTSVHKAEELIGGQLYGLYTKNKEEKILYSSKTEIPDKGINITFIRREDIFASTVKVTDFRPQVDCRFPALYLNDRYENILLKFLKTNSHESYYLDKGKAVDFLKKRLYIRKYRNVVKGTIEFEIETDRVRRINFDKDLRFAIIEFDHSILCAVKKDDGTWVKYDSGMVFT